MTRDSRPEENTLGVDRRRAPARAACQQHRAARAMRQASAHRREPRHRRTSASAPASSPGCRRYLRPQPVRRGTSGAYPSLLPVVVAWFISSRRSSASASPSRPRGERMPTWLFGALPRRPQACVGRARLRRHLAAARHRAQFATASRLASASALLVAVTLRRAQRDPARDAGCSASAFVVAILLTTPLHDATTLPPQLGVARARRAAARDRRRTSCAASGSWCSSNSTACSCRAPSPRRASRSACSPRRSSPGSTSPRRSCSTRSPPARRRCR